MRYQRRVNPICACFEHFCRPFCVCLDYVSEHVVISKIEQTHLAQDCSQASLLHDIRGDIPVEVHVVEQSSSCLEHLVDCKLRPEANKTLGLLQRCLHDKFPLRRENVVKEPVLQWKIVRIATEKGHRRVRVTVDQPGDEDMSRQAQIGSSSKFIARDDSGDLAALDNNHLVFKHSWCVWLDSGHPACMNAAVAATLRFNIHFTTFISGRRGTHCALCLELLA
mmetsp:Transcript_145443/g.252591  ORF Transcript_145443/g.252591 Transcript_145443/m.252591 type:complete len:223 (+) Transcript_145443:204-872(+)